MAQFDVYRLNMGDIVLDIQSNAFAHLATRVVVPLVAAGDVIAPGTKLNPIVRVADIDRILMPQMIGTISKTALRVRIGSLTSEYLRIEAAIDTLTGSY